MPIYRNELWTNDVYLKDINFGQVKLLSIDLFDTLLFRIFESPDLFYKALCILCIKAGLIDKHYNPHIFQFVRNNAGVMAYKKSKVAQLNDIYECMPYFKNKKNIYEMEFELEKVSTILNESIVSLISHANRVNIPVVLSSDMYLTKNQIIDLLVFNNFDISLLTDIYVSSEIGCAKHNGTMYDYIKNKHSNIESNNILHIGDNFFSDYINAKVKKLESIHYNVIPQKLFSKLHVEELYHNEVIFPELLSLRKLGASLNKYIGTELEVWFDIGVSIIGPFFSMACEFITDFCIEKKICNLYPIMREGKLFIEILKTSFNDRGYKINIKPVYVSRKTTLLARLSEVTPDIIKYSNPLDYLKSFLTCWIWIIIRIVRKFQTYSISK